MKEFGQWLNDFSKKEEKQKAEPKCAKEITNYGPDYNLTLEDLESDLEQWQQSLDYEAQQWDLGDYDNHKE